jgi:hypothetical protein
MPLTRASTPAGGSPPIPVCVREPLALRREDAAAVIGVSDETFDKHVRPSLPCVRLGSVRVYPVEGLRDWLLEHADTPTAELERRR